MKFKMRMLHFTKGCGADDIAASIARAQGATCDQIPPAYNCENEKLVFVCVDAGKKLDEKVTKFMSYLNPSRVKNIAFVAIGSDTSACLSELKEMATSRDVNVVSELSINVKNGLFKKGKVKDIDIENAVKWAEGVVDGLAN